MSRLTDFLEDHWLALTLLLLGSAALGMEFRRSRQTGVRRFGWLVLSLAVVFFAAGGLCLPGEAGGWMAAGAAVGLLGMVVVLLVSGRWYAPSATGLAILLLAGLGGAFAEALTGAAAETARSLASLRPMQPWWLLLLLLLPLVVWLGRRSLAGLGPTRQRLVLGLRCLLITLLVLALAEVRLRHDSDDVTVLFVLDRSLSIPEESDADAIPGKASTDLRFERVKRFINTAVEERGAAHRRDRAGLIVFGRAPRLELPASDAPRFNFNEVASPIDGTYTDIAAALKLALASFPEGSSRRVVLLSDGNENLGDAVEQARLAKLNGVQIDVVPLGAGIRNESEAIVEGITAPSLIEQGSQLPLTVHIRSFNPNIIVGTLSVTQISEGQTTQVPSSPRRVELQAGLNTFTFQQALADQQRSYSYQATFLPEFVQDARGRKLVEGLPGSRPQNKRATTHVVARGQRRILLVENTRGDHDFLATRLRGAGNGKFKLTVVAADSLPKDKDQLGLFLSNFDSVLLADVPAEALSEEQQEMLRSNTHDQGSGLVMIGGQDSFGAGGWQGTAVEKALPVDADIKSLKVQGKGGLVLLMHASEMANGNFWQKKIAKLALEKLGPGDEVGVLYFDWGQMKWHIPLQEIGDKRNDLLAQIDKMAPGDMPDFDPGLKMAHEALMNPDKGLATKHVIIISDGDPIQNNAALLPSMKADKITVSTVGVATHGPAQDKSMQRIARATGGTPYFPKKADELPAIYTKETRKVSQSFVLEKDFQPRLLYRSGPTERLPEPPVLHGLVRTTPKPSPLVEMPIRTPPFAEQEFPILAYWHYGLGKAVAYTSDASAHGGRKFWGKDWAESEIYTRFWEQVVDWSLRATESKRLTMRTDYHDGKVKVVVDAADENNRPLVDLTLRAGVTAPGAPAKGEKFKEIVFRQTNSGSYEAEFKAEEAGSYFINAQATRKVKVIGKDGKETEIDEGFDSVRAGATIPYSQEFAVMESNTQLLESLRRETDGLSYADDDAVLAEAARSGEVFRKGSAPFHTFQPVWHWLLVFAGVVLVFDVATRRIAIEPAWVAAKSRDAWDRLRGRSRHADATPQFLERLRTRKAEVEESLARERAARRFEGAPVPTAAPPGAADLPAPTATPSPLPSPGVTPESEKDTDDFGSRLLKAKKRVWKDKEPPS